MKKLIITLLAVLFLTTSAFAATGIKGATCLTGGTAGCLDYYNGSTLNDGDVAIVSVDGLIYFYRLDDDSAATESSPAIIGPDSGGGDKRWILQEVVGTATITTLANDATPSIAAGTKFVTGGTTTITDFDDGYTGKIIYVIAAHTVTITDGTNILLSGSANWTMTATDTLTLIQKADTYWYELSRGDNGA